MKKSLLIIVVLLAAGGIDVSDSKAANKREFDQSVIRGRIVPRIRGNFNKRVPKLPHSNHKHEAFSGIKDFWKPPKPICQDEYYRHEWKEVCRSRCDTWNNPRRIGCDCYH